MKGAERFFQRSGRVPLVNMVDIDVISLQVLQRSINRGSDVLTRRANVISALAHSQTELCAQHELLSRSSAHPLTNDAFSFTIRISVGPTES